MAYFGKWIGVVLATAYVMKVDGCDRRAAMQQMAAAIRDRELRAMKLTDDWRQWRTDGEIFLSDLKRLWPRPDVLKSGASAPDNTGKEAYAQRVAMSLSQGKNLPLQTTKAGVQGDREWAAENKVPRADVEKWRKELLPKRLHGRPPNSAEKSAEKSAEN